MSDYTLDYAAVAIAGVAGLGVVFLSFFLSHILSPRRPSAQKATPYECGMLPQGKFWDQLHLRYYLFAIFFLIFDVELVFLFPWALVFLGAGPAVFFEMVLFIGVLAFALVYGLKKGALKWQ
ncbi:MAG: NADH-quinone oxidoreductase subunit A [Chloroflexi bacterium]|nr:NADH-quinone oxidoreductase subunit A [Chloroflexota bacterium]